MIKFVVLLPAFHMEAYVARAIHSVWKQRYPHVRIIGVEDHGADGTRAIMLEAADTSSVPFLFWSNIRRQGILGNHVAMLQQCADDEIAVCLDGDDQLAHEGVLETLADVYADPSVWMTYGSYEFDPESTMGDPAGIAAQVPDPHTRREALTATHLKTFRVALFRHVNDADLRFRGAYIDPAGDVALMAPLIEMAGPQHARFIPDILYLYNGSNPLNDVKIKPTWIPVMVEEIMGRPVYPRLAAL